jgi:hypothetical protein
MKTIIIKEVNRVFDGSEYLIYLTENDNNIFCYNVIGEELKDKVVGELLEKNSDNTSILEITLEEFLKTNKKDE